jgi:hypothetical protein
MFWVQVVFYVHWALDILFALACLSVIFKPNIWARVYVTVFFAQQLILNGCIMTAIAGYVETKAGLIPDHNQFIMAYLTQGGFVVLYKLLFAVIIITQIIEIILTIKRSRKPKLSNRFQTTNEYRAEARKEIKI